MAQSAFECPKCKRCTCNRYLSIVCKGDIDVHSPKVGEGDMLACGEGDMLACGEGDMLACGEGDMFTCGEGDMLACGEVDMLTWCGCTSCILNFCTFNSTG